MWMPPSSTPTNATVWSQSVPSQATAQNSYSGTSWSSSQASMQTVTSPTPSWSSQSSYSNLSNMTTSSESQVPVQTSYSSTLWSQASPHTPTIQTNNAPTPSWLQKHHEVVTPAGYPQTPIITPKTNWMSQGSPMVPQAQTTQWQTQPPVQSSQNSSAFVLEDDEAQYMDGMRQQTQWEDQSQAPSVNLNGSNIPSQSQAPSVLPYSNSSSSNIPFLSTQNQVPNTPDLFSTQRVHYDQQTPQTPQVRQQPPQTPQTNQSNPLQMSPDVQMLMEHKLHPMLCMEHMGEPGIGEIRAMVSYVNSKSPNFGVRTVDGKDYTLIYNKFLPVREGDYIHALAKIVAPYNLEIVAHPTVFTPRSGKDIENMIKQRFGKYGFQTVQFMKTLETLAKNRNLVAPGVENDMLRNIDTPVGVLDYLAEQYVENPKNHNLMHMFPHMDKKKINMLLDFWASSIVLRRLYLLGFTKKQIRETGMKPAQLHASIIFNPYTIAQLPMTRCYELDLCTGRLATLEEARAGEILRAVYNNTKNKGWNATNEGWIIKRYPDLPDYADMLQKYYRMVCEEITHYKDTYVEVQEQTQNPDLGFHCYEQLEENSEFFKTTTEYPCRREETMNVKVWYLKKNYMAEKMLSRYLEARLGKGPLLDSLSEDDLNDDVSLSVGKGQSRDGHRTVTTGDKKETKLEKLFETRQAERKKSASDFRSQTITHKGPIYGAHIQYTDINVQLDPQQASAVFTALCGGVSILTGGPGCGKTFCIREICRLLDKYNIPYMLASFVGKAVSRMREVVCQGVGKSNEKKDIHASGVGSVHESDVSTNIDVNNSTDDGNVVSVATAELSTIEISPDSNIEDEKDEEDDEDEMEVKQKEIEPGSGVWMSEINPATIHSMIGRASQKDAPFFRVLIIDEASMLEINLLYDFMCVYGTNFGIVFVGDANQLPPIGPGSLFNEMIKSRAIPKTVLSTYHRLDDGSDNDALLLNMKSIVRWKEGLPYVFAQGDNFEILSGESEEVYHLLIALSSQGYKKDDICVICPYKAYSDNLNEISQLYWNSDNRHVVEPNGKNWYIGDNVLFLTNSKDLGVYNGEKGVILDSEPPGLFSHGEEVTKGLQGLKVDFGQNRICIIEITKPKKKQNLRGETISDKTGTTYVDSDGNTQVYTSDSVQEEIDVDSVDISTADLSLAYCLSVHKAQGSEYPVVIFIMPMFAKADHKSFINRNMIYTGISRARERVIHLGNIMTTTQSIGNKLPYRCEFLSDRLLKVLPRLYALEKIEELTKYEEDPDDSFDPDDDDMW